MKKVIIFLLTITIHVSTISAQDNTGFKFSLWDHIVNGNKIYFNDITYLINNEIVASVNIYSKNEEDSWTDFNLIRTLNFDLNGNITSVIHFSTEVEDWAQYYNYNQQNELISSFTVNEQGVRESGSDFTYTYEYLLVNGAESVKRTSYQNGSIIETLIEEETETGFRLHRINGDKQTTYLLSYSEEQIFSLVIEGTLVGHPITDQYNYEYEDGELKSATWITNSRFASGLLDEYRISTDMSNGYALIIQEFNHRIDPLRLESTRELSMYDNHGNWHLAKFYNEDNVLYRSYKREIAYR